MRSNRDKRTDSEREIDEFLSQFEPPVDEMSADVNQYLDEPDGISTSFESFYWGDDTSSERIRPEHEDSLSDSSGGEKSVTDQYLGDTKTFVKKKASGYGRHSQADTPAMFDSLESFILSEEDITPELTESEVTEFAQSVAEFDSSEEADISETSADNEGSADDGASADEEPVDDNAGSDEPDAEINSDEGQSEEASEESNEEADQSEETETASKARPKKNVKRLTGVRLKNATFKSAAASKVLGEKLPEIRKKSLKQKLFLKPNPDYDPDQPVSKNNKEYKVSVKKIILDLVGVGVFFILCCVVAAGIIIYTAPSYDYSDIYSAVDTSSMIYDDEDKQVDSVFYTQNRKVVKYKDMPEDLVNSFIAIEDKTFWKHHGFNWTRMIGAILSSFTGNGRISGTSTITQQLSRNVYLADTKSQRSIKRKILEMYYAARLEHALSKEEIIEAYLNTIYLGHGCYGVNAAAKTYFSTKPSKLSLIQCASLAALPQSPDNYALLKFADEMQTVSDDSKIVAREPDTIVTNDISKERRDLTLKLMLDQGLISQADYDDNVGKALNSFIKPTITSGNGIYSYYHEYLVDTVINDLMKKYDMEYDDAERMVYTGGLKIYSTIDSKAQKVISKEFQDPSNFPGINAIYRTDEDGNMLNNDDEIALYNYEHDFNENGDFILNGDEVKINDDGSVTITKDKKLHIYETEVDGATDYSLEFKSYFINDDGLIYSIQGGYINVPSTYKSLDSDGNLKISADYFKEHPDEMKISDGSLIITDNAYSLASKTIQPQGAMVIVEVGTGKVKAMAGGRTFKGQKLLNRALNTRQPGSSIKPLAVYGAALQKSYDLHEDGKKWSFIDFGIDKQGTKGWGDYVTVHSSIEDEKTHIEDRDWPNNVTNSFSGKNNFKTAIQRSINTCAVKLQLQVGNTYSMDQLKKFGITTALEDESQYANDMNPAALALGAMCEGVTPLEMALAYSAFPGEGKVNTPICYTKVKDRDGKVLLEGESTATEALNSGVAWIMTDVLKSVVTANGYSISEIQTGGKTGTTNDKYDIWFDGFTPTYAASLWIGTDQNVEMTDMSYVAANLWGKIIAQCPKAISGSYPEMPSNVIQQYGEYFTEGTNTGLTSWSAEEERKKREAAARAKWESERKNHRHKVEEKGHYETKIVSPETYKDEKYTEIIHHKAEYDEDGNVVKEAYDEEVVKHRKVVDKPAVTKKVWVVDEKEHWEYDKGWRDGDFHYSE